MRSTDYARYDRWRAKVVLGVQSAAIPRIRAVRGLEEVKALLSFFEAGMVRPVGTAARRRRSTSTPAAGRSTSSATTPSSWRATGGGCARSYVTSRVG